MKISKITIENFRSYYGKHEIKLATGENDETITIFIGANGSGKTNFLNAIYYALTGKFTAKLNEKIAVNPLLIHKDAYKSGIRECTVELDIEDGLEKYHLTRTFTESSDFLSLLKIDTNGISKPITNQIAKRMVKLWMPETLANWFIIEGESINKMELKGDSKLKEEMHETFGFGHIRKLSIIIEDYRKTLAKEERKIIADDNLNQLGIKIESIEERLNNCRNTIINLKGQYTQHQNDVNNAVLQLEKYSGASELQKEVNQLRKSLIEATASYKNALEKRSKFTSDNVLPKLLQNRIEILATKLNIKADEQTLPEPYGTRLIEDIMEIGKCICGTTITENSVEKKHLEKLILKAASSQFQNKIFSVRSQLDRYISLNSKYVDDIRVINSDIIRYEKEINDHKSNINNADKLIEALPEDEIKALKSKENKGRVMMRTIDQEIGQTNQKIADANSALQSLENEYNTKVNLKSRNNKISDDRKKVEKIEQYLKQKFDYQEKQVLKILQEEVSQVMSKFMTKHYSVSIDPADYSMIVKDIDDQNTDVSEGESEIVKFAFIGAIVGMAANRTSLSSIKWLTEPIVAPLIMDAPFSKVDSDYRAAIGITLAQMSSQLILFFDQDKWDDKLFEAIHKNIGHSYLIIANAKGNEKQNFKEFKFKGKSLKLNKYGERDESTISELVI
jgi:DNA sulfur modification protein DndD